MEKLDHKDIRILFELDKNSRQPASSIAKKVSLSGDIVNYRIKKLIDKKVIFKFMTLLDTAKLGLTTYKVFYRFQNTTLEKEKEIIDFLISHRNTQSAQGIFDLNVNLVAESVEELNKILTEFDLRYGKYFAERFVNILVESHFFFRDYLIERKSDELRKPMFFGSDPKKIDLDIYNKKILQILADNARISSLLISKKIGISADAIIQRIKSLEKKGVIQNYVLIPNSENIGYNWYYILLKFRDLTSADEKRFFTHSRVHPNVWFYTKMIGSWDFLINIDVKNDNELKEILTQIKKDFSKILKEYIIIRIPKLYKFNQYPGIEYVL